jgi:hypothetical protein
MEREEERATYEGFLGAMLGAASQNNIHGRKGKGRSISLKTTCRSEHNSA